MPSYSNRRSELGLPEVSRMSANISTGVPSSRDTEIRRAIAKILNFPEGYGLDLFQSKDVNIVGVVSSDRWNKRVHPDFPSVCIEGHCSDTEVREAKNKVLEQLLELAHEKIRESRSLFYSELFEVPLEFRLDIWDGYYIVFEVIGDSKAISMRLVIDDSTSKDVDPSLLGSLLEWQVRKMIELSDKGFNVRMSSGMVDALDAVFEAAGFYDE